MSKQRVHVRLHDKGNATIMIYMTHADIFLSLTAEELKQWKEEFSDEAAT